MASGPHTTIRMNTLLRNRLADKAAAYGVSRTELIEIVMSDFLDKDERDAPRLLRLKKEIVEAKSGQSHDLFA